MDPRKSSAEVPATGDPDKEKQINMLHHCM